MAEEEKRKRQELAEAKRTEALAYLSQHGCGPATEERNGRISFASGAARPPEPIGDNTASIVRARKALLQEEPGWAMVRDNESGNFYWWNRQTNDVSWSNPARRQNATTCESSRRQKCPQHLLTEAAAWIEVRHPSSLQNEEAAKLVGPGSYFWNALTNDTSWTPPLAARKEEGANLSVTTPSTVIAREEQEKAIREYTWKFDEEGELKS